MKSTSKRSVKQWNGMNDRHGEFKLFYLSGDLLSKLNDLASEESQSELLADLIRDEHRRRFNRESPNG